MLGWEVIPGISIGSLRISPHGVGIALGYFLGVIWMARRARKVGFSEDHVWNAALWGMVGAILGARIAYVVGHFEQFASLGEILAVWRGGISVIGGFSGGIGAGYLYTRRHNIPFFKLMDFAAPGLALGTIVGRLGDLTIGDHLGRQTEGFWSWTYLGGELISPPPCQTPTGAPVYSTADGCLAAGISVHQTALYDLLWAIVILGVLFLIQRRPRPTGFLFMSWAFLYALGRIVTDFLRVDKTWFGLGLTGSQLTSITFVVVSLVILARFKPVPAESESGEEVPELVGDSD